MAVELFVRATLGAGLVVGLLLWGCASSPENVDDYTGEVEPGSEQEVIRLSLGGDVMFGRWVAGGWRGYEAPQGFEEVRRHMRESHLSFVNLETGLCDEDRARRRQGEVSAQYHRFTAPPQRVDWLVDSGVELAVVANNHALDCGNKGLDESVEVLEERGIGVAGLRSPDDGRWREVQLRLEQKEVVVLAATMHLPPVRSKGVWKPAVIDETEADELLNEVERVRHQFPKALLVVSLHWGRELDGQPGPGQRRLAKQLVQMGVDVVYGHGPHVLQESKIIDGAAVVYSAGNLHFDMERMDTRKVGLVDVLLEFDDRWRVAAVEEPFAGRLVPRAQIGGGGADEKPGGDAKDGEEKSAEDYEADEVMEPRWGRREATVEVFFDDRRRRGFFRVRQGGREWTSEIYPMWTAKLADLDGDGRHQIVVGMWSYQMRHDESLPRRTLWVLGWDGRRLYPEWRGSGLARPMEDFSIVSASGADELVATERAGERCLSTTYRWTGFGFAERHTEAFPCSE